MGVGAIVRARILQWRFEVIGWAKTGDNGEHCIARRSRGEGVGIAMAHNETPREVDDNSPQQSMTEGNDEVSHNGRNCFQ